MLRAALSQPDEFAEMLDSLEDGVYLVDRTMADGVPRSSDVWLHHKSGQRVPVSVRTAPIRDGVGEIIGAIEFFTDGSRLEASEEQISKLKALALSDPLTGLPNRRFAELTLSGRLAEVEHHHRTLGAVFADIDRFKAVNDSYGHDVGDEVLSDGVLKMVASTLSRNVRHGDAATRFGGEEFVLVLPDADPAEVRALAERLCMLVRRSSIDLASAGELSVTISMGATLATAHDDVAGLLHRADQLLYRSKQRRPRSRDHGLAVSSDGRSGEPRACPPNARACRGAARHRQAGLR